MYTKKINTLLLLGWLYMYNIKINIKMKIIQIN